MTFFRISYNVTGKWNLNIAFFEVDILYWNPKRANAFEYLILDLIWVAVRFTWKPD